MKESPKTAAGASPPQDGGTQARPLPGSVDAVAFTRTIDGRITSWPAAMEHLYGFTSDQALGQIAHRMLRTMFPAATADVEAALLSEHSWRGAVIHRHADGRAILVSSHCRLTDGDEPSEAATVIELHTEAAGLDVADVVAIIASELSEPLTAIASYVAGARQTLQRDVPDQVIALRAMSLAADQTVRGAEQVKLLRGLAQDLRRTG